MKSLKSIFLLLFGLFNFSIALGQGALPYTTVQQSTLLLGSGQIGAALPNDYVLGFYFNPAILGYSARNNHVSFSLMPAKTKLRLPNEYRITSKFTFNNFGFNTGYNFKTSKLNLPVTIGFGYIHHKFDYGELSVTTVEIPDANYKVESYDIFNNFSLGLGVDYFLKFYLGISLKQFDSKLGGRIEDGMLKENAAKGIMFDYGALVIFPFYDLIMSDIRLKIDKATVLKPVFNFTLGYSLTNVGKEIYYFDDTQKVPLSRTARLGYTIEIGVNFVLKDIVFNLFNYSFTAEADDILVNPRYTADGNLSENYKMYQNVLGDINFFNHLIKLKSDDKVTLHKGHIFRFFDTMFLTAGSFKGRGYSLGRKTSGFGFTSKGIFKLLNTQINESTINYILEHFVIDYFKANVEFYSGYKTRFDDLSIHFRGIKI